MKPISARITETIAAEGLFSVREVYLPSFSTEFHFHKECQLVYIVESDGRRIIGDNIDHFHKGEVIFLGSGIPHVWHNDQRLNGDGNRPSARSISVFFNSDTLLEHLAHFGSTRKIEMFLSDASKGLQFQGAPESRLRNLLRQALQLSGLKAFINFLNMLDIMTCSREYRLLASDGYVNNYQNRNNDRIDRVFKYVFDHFNEEVTLSGAARVACMNVQAFCRYFKARTQRPFIQFVNEVRIGHACKLLETRQMAITAVAFNCGFNSISNFNRAFRELKGMTPRGYRKMLV